ncbi:phosphonate ABC transporter, permease protein PhnE, partial [Candidatus Bipolaricaulota bacterium]|nr:phosphonate ABC transporter, permease protein PhnE [Candidatus Bipolaricaulota bacterium]
MKEKYYAGFMTERPSWRKARRAFLKDMSILATDVLFLASLWWLGSYIWNDLFHQTRDFLSVPWWIMVVSVIELAFVWQSFGLSPGMKLLGRRLVNEQDGPWWISLGRRSIRVLLLHVMPALLFQVILTTRYTPWHDRFLGFRSASAAEIDEIRVPWYRCSSAIAVIAVGLAMYLASALFTQIDLVKLFTNASSTSEIWNKIFHPDWSILRLGIRLLIVTLFMAFMATFFGVIVAIPLSFLAARNLSHGFIGRTIYTVLRILMSIIRSIQPFIWAIIFVVWVRTGAAAFAGALALFVHSVADLTKLYSERLESIDPGPVEAIRATGAGRLHVILYGVVPQIVNPYLSFTIYRWDINVRMATIIGLVGGGGIGQRLLQLTRNWVWDQAIVLMLLIMFAVMVMDYSSSRLRERL